MTWTDILNLSPINGIRHAAQNPMSMLTNPTSPILGYPINSSWDNLLDPTNVTDTLGITDTEAGERGLAELENRSQQASNALDAGLADVNKQYLDAISDGRSLSDVLNRYNETTSGALGRFGDTRTKALKDYKNQMMGTEDATSEENVQKFLNPMYSRAIENATNRALGGAGSSLQSSAANQAVGTAVSNEVANMWNKAFADAMTDAQNKQGIYGQTYGASAGTANDIYGNTVNLAGQQANMNMMPFLNWAQLQSDVSGTKYTKDMDLAQAAAQVAGQNQSWLGNFF